LEARLITRPCRGGKRKGGRRGDKTRGLARSGRKAGRRLFLSGLLFIRSWAKTFWRVTPPPLY
jgi:hypothetical protein